MAKLSRRERLEIGKRRILSVLGARGVANLRTLEQKIADAGPNPQRVQPHVITTAKKLLLKEGSIGMREAQGAQWLFRSDTPNEIVEHRLAELIPVWEEFVACRQTGQALEIAVYRALISCGGVTTFGGFSDLEAHDDGQLYSKEEIHTINGKSLGKRALDFIIDAGGLYCGVEVKNVRPWLYPHDNELREAIQKAITLDILPVIIARRIPYVTFKLLGACGVVFHETYNQRMANADAALAQKAKDKNLLGYHDIKLGNLSDIRLDRFVQENLIPVAKGARPKFDRYIDILEPFASGDMPYHEFAARVRRRQHGQNEDHDWEDGEEFDSTQY